MCSVNLAIYYRLSSILLMIQLYKFSGVLYYYLHLTTSQMSTIYKVNQFHLPHLSDYESQYYTQSINAQDY